MRTFFEIIGGIVILGAVIFVVLLADNLSPTNENVINEKQETIDSLTDKVESQERYINFLESQNDMLMNKEMIEKDIEEGLNEN